MKLFFFILIFLSKPVNPRRNIEHTPLHKRNVQQVLVDVRDAHVHFSASSWSLDPAFHISANTTHIRNGDYVTITWENPTPGLFDMVALYTPPTRPVQDYLDFRYITDTKGWSTGKGSFTEMLFNMRSDYELRYLSVNQDMHATVRATFKVSVQVDEPMHGHIGLTGKPGEMRVMWGSARVHEPRILFSTSKQGLIMSQQRVMATSTTYSAEDLCGPRANITNPLMFQNPGYFHSAVLQNLKPGVRYYYSYGTDNATSPITSFVAPPYKARVTSFIGFGDMGAYYPPYQGSPVGAAAVTHAIEKEIVAEEINFLLHFGDLSYARGRGYIWDQFMTQMTRVASQVPYMVGVGNHEYDHVAGGEKDPSGAQAEGFHPNWGNFGDDGGGECGVPTMHRYIVPDTGNKVFWYSFNYGLIHVVQFSSEHDFRPGSRQYEWLRNDLRNVDRTQTPWIVVTSHRPIYTSQDSEGDHIVSRHLRMALEELFYSYRVNLHLSGHYHSYESSCSVVSGDCVEPGSGTVYIVVGTGGYGLEAQDYIYYPWSQTQNCKDHGYSKVVVNETHMHVQFVTTPHRTVKDNFVIPIWK